MWGPDWSRMSRLVAGAWWGRLSAILNTLVAHMSMFVIIQIFLLIYEKHLGVLIDSSFPIFIWPTSYLLWMILYRDSLNFDRQRKRNKQNQMTEEACCVNRNWSKVSPHSDSNIHLSSIYYNMDFLYFSSYTINHFYVTFQMNLSQLQIYIYWDGTGSLSTGELSWLISSHYWTASSMSGLANIGVWSIQL